ncbi:MAG: hypothetical protein ISS70_12215 [Phycisphaerae bacterium]|nr:hypothetical protein [Phycisphaerae bacterium]
MSKCNYSRRTLLKAMGLGAVTIPIAGCSGSLSSLAGKSKQPNIVLIFADDMGYGALVNRAYPSTEQKYPILLHQELQGPHADREKQCGRAGASHIPCKPSTSGQGWFCQEECDGQLREKPVAQAADVRYDLALNTGIARARLCISESWSEES